MRITGQLIDTATGAHIWADRFDGTLDDIFELQDQVASSVVGAIEPKLRLAEIERAIRKPTESLGAYDLYLRSLAQVSKITPERLSEAIALLKRALAIDPSYAPAAARVALCRVSQVSFGLGRVSEAEISEAVHLATQAIEIGKDDADALWMGAHALSFFARAHGIAAGCVAPIRGRQTRKSPMHSRCFRLRERHFEAHTRSDAANLWKMHRRRGQPMVLYVGSGFLDSGNKARGSGCGSETNATRANQAHLLRRALSAPFAV